MPESTPSAPEKEPMPARSTTLNEHAAYFDKYPEDIKAEYLNNMYLWLPGDPYLKIIKSHMGPKEVRRETAVAQELEEQPEVRDAVEAHKAHMAAINQELEDIDRTMKEETAKTQEAPEEVRVAKYRELAPLRNRQMELLKSKGVPQELNKLLVPLYLALRKKGFSHMDLVQ